MRPTPPTSARPARCTPPGAAIAALLALAVLTGCSSDDEAAGATASSDDGTEAERPVVETARAETRSREKTLRVSTTLAPSRTLQVTPEVGGVVDEIYVQQGEAVEAGDPLVRIASVDYSLQVDSAKTQSEAAEAGLNQARAQLETTKKQYERFQKLYEQDVVAKSQFEEVETAYERAKAGYESAKAQAEGASVGIEQAENQVRDTTVRAPFDGHVVQRMLDEGSVVRPMASPVLVLIDDDPIRAEASVSELHLSEIDEGMAASVTVDAYPDREFDGELTMLNRQVEARTREAAIRVELPNDDAALTAGMSGTLTLQLGTRRQLVVPRTAVFEREGKEATVYVVDSERARRREVTLEPGFETDLPIAEGLSEGDRVVTWGSSQLRDGARIEIRSEDDGGGTDDSSGSEGGSR